MNLFAQVKQLSATPKQSQFAHALKHILVHTQTVFDFDGMTRQRRLIARLTVVVFSLVIIFIRMPIVFLHPAFWGEDGSIYFQLSYLDGWSSIITGGTAGYLTLFQWLVGNFAIYFPVSVVPAIFNAAAIVLTLAVVWLVTSPRLPLPAKPLLALAVVTVPAGYEELGTLANSQWIFPLGVFALLLMAPSKSRLVFAAEATFVSIFSLTGPFSLLLLPVCGLQIILNQDVPAAARRALILSGLIAAGAAVECIYISKNLETALTPNLAPIPSSWQLWVVLPIVRITDPIGHVILRALGEGPLLPIALIAFGSVAYFALRAPYRQQKVAMLLFAFAIIIAGMIKDRLVLPLNGMRYYYAAQVFSIWFFCCIPQTKRIQEIFTSIVALALLIMVLAGANRPRAGENGEWLVWSREIHSGLPVKIPTDPQGWFITLPADPNGPLVRFASWPGKELRELEVIHDDLACTGALDEVRSAIEVNGGSPQWIVKGWANSVDRQRAVSVIVLTDSENFVLGFGFPGFASRERGKMSGWAGVVQSLTPNIHAFAIVSGNNDAICRLTVVSH
jgi:hypothetical protein